MFCLKVGDLPKGCLSGDNDLYDFYPYHVPEKTCYAHTVIACKKVDSPPSSYKEPTRSVRNDFKAKFIAALNRADMPTLPESLLLDMGKYWAASKALRT